MTKSIINTQSRQKLSRATVTLTAVTLMMLSVLFSVGCSSQTPADVTPAATEIVTLPTETSPSLAVTVAPSTTTPTATSPPVTPTNTPIPPTSAPTATVTPYYKGSPSTPCGQLLPLQPAMVEPVSALAPDAAQLAIVRSQIPLTAMPAFERLLDNPESVALVAYAVGLEESGAFLNADVPMPVASVSKVIHLAAYAQAVSAGELNPLSPVPVSEIDRFYLPGLDLGTYDKALTELEEAGKVSGQPPTIILDDVVWMMIRHSANAPTDYLHMLLGQERIEETAVTLGLTAHTAPCPYVGQFLAMANQTRAGVSDTTAFNAYLADPASYGVDASLLTDAFSEDTFFHQSQIDWRQDTRRPTIETQRRFSDQWGSQGSAGEYAALMTRFSQNGLSDGESSFIARRQLEWPMLFGENQELFSNLGYKNGTLPGVLTTVYYAYPLGSDRPIVVVLFYRDLPQSTYRQWQRELPHDAFARWILSDPNAIPGLAALLADGK